jgi:hypothetical protein
MLNAIAVSFIAALLIAIAVVLLGAGDPPSGGDAP